MISAIKDAKERVFTCSNRLPALAVIVKKTVFGKVVCGKMNVRHHFKICTQMVPHIIQVFFIGNKIRGILRPCPAVKFCDIFLLNISMEHLL